MSTTEGPPRSSVKAIEKKLFPSSAVRNKVRRQTLYKAERIQRNKERRQRREKRKKEREQLGEKVTVLSSTAIINNYYEKAPPPRVLTTITNLY